MKQKLLQFSKAIATLVFIGVFFGLAIVNTPQSIAVKATDFKAGRIIDDSVFYDSSTMTVAQIQNFMDNTLPTCDMWGTGKVGYGYYINGKAVDPNTTRKEYARRMREEVGDKRYHAPPYVCINKYYENPSTHVSNFDTNGVAKSGMLSAAQIIYNAAKEYSINPQVLLVMLKKESYAWGDNWPTKNEYNTVMGYACPDNAACDTKYYGFYNQVNMAAWQLDYYKKHIYSYNYRPYATNKIYYSPTYSCGTKSVYIENYATASLYIYTPYTPNDAALKNYPGTATCGSYGNRNFFMYFSEWFGSTLFTAKTTSISDGDYYLFSKKDTSKYLRLINSGDQYSLSFQKKEAGYVNNIFLIKKNSDNSFSIINTAHNMALDAGSSPEEGKNVTLATYNESSATQKWIIYNSGTDTYSFSPLKNKSVALTYDENNAKFVLSTYTKAGWQKFGIDNPLADSGGGTNTTNPNEGSTSTTPSTSTTNQKTIGNGTYALVSTLNYTSSLAPVGNGTANNTALNLWSTTNAAGQNYVTKYDANTGYYTFKNIRANKYLTAKTTTVKNNVSVVISSQNNLCSQKWIISKNSDNTYKVASACDSSFVISVSGGNKKNGTPIILYKDNGSTAQKFTFFKHEGAALNGQYYIQSKTNTSYVIEVAGTKFANGKNIRLYKNTYDKTQRFTIKYYDSCGCYKIISYNSNYSLDVANGKKANGTNVQLYKNDSTNAQRWYIAKDMNGYYRIRNIGSLKMLNLNANTIKSGTNINIWQDGNANSQKWYLKRIK